MYLDVVDLRAFYADRLGGIARKLIGAEAEAALADGRRRSALLGIGYATPYLPDLAEGPSACSPSCRRCRAW